MELRQLGATELRVSPVIFGAWAIGGWMWGGKDDEGARDAIRAAIDSGINTIDTAAGYGFGHSETLVGQAIQGRRDKVIVATKCGLRWTGDNDPNFKPPADSSGLPGAFHKDSDPESLLWQCEQSLRRLGVETIDLYQFHRADPDVPIDKSLAALEKLKKQGKIRAIGVSNFDLKWHKDAIALSKIASSQPPFSIIRRGIEKDILPFCKENNVGVICYSPMERGLLTGSAGPDRKFASGDHRLRHPTFSMEYRKKITERSRKCNPLPTPTRRAWPS